MKKTQCGTEGIPLSIMNGVSEMVHGLYSPITLPCEWATQQSQSLYIPQTNIRLADVNGMCSYVKWSCSVLLRTVNGLSVLITKMQKL